MTEERAKKLIWEAKQALIHSYAPYSNFNVGAALLTLDGKIYHGCNIENASYGATNCAERTAFFKAVSEGERDFVALCIIGGKDAAEKILNHAKNPITTYAYPCGLCRQVMMEFCDPHTFEVVVAIDEELYEVYPLNELLPLGFGPSNLQED